MEVILIVESFSVSLQDKHSEWPLIGGAGGFDSAEEAREFGEDYVARHSNFADEYTVIVYRHTKERVS